MIIKEIKGTAELFEDASFRHEDRSSNGEAHRLARSLVDRDVGRRVWLINPPDGFFIPLNIVADE
jgi:hypothetical protein